MLQSSPMATRHGPSSSEPHARAEGAITFEQKQTVMKMFSDNAKTYIQLSGAALALTLTFAREILHIPADKNIADGWMIAMWICFLVTILAGAFYQYLAVKFLEHELDWDSFRFWNHVSPGTFYAVMLGAFYSGTLIFTIYAIVRISHPSK